MIVDRLRRIGMSLNLFATEIEHLAAKQGLSSPKELDFGIRVKLAVSKFRKSQEGELGLNYFEAGHDTYVGVVIVAREYGPDVAAYAVKKGFAKVPKDQKREMIKSLNYRAAEEGWKNPNLEPFISGTIYQKVQLYKL